MALFCHTWLPCFASYLILPRGFLFLFSVLKAWLRVPGGPLSKKLLCKVSLSIALSLLSVCIRKRKWPPSTPSRIFSWVQTKIAIKCHRKPTIESISNREAVLPQAATAKARISFTDISRRRSRRFSLKTVLAVITTTLRKLLCVQLISLIEFIHTALQEFHSPGEFHRVKPNIQKIGFRIHQLIPKLLRNPKISQTRLNAA